MSPGLSGKFLGLHERPFFKALFTDHTFSPNYHLYKGDKASDDDYDDNDERPKRRYL